MYFLFNLPKLDLFVVKYFYCPYSNQNLMSMAYGIVKRQHDELFICCMTFVDLYNNYSMCI
jgi:hypothetical protein